ncbi:muscarinic acetylcholine receptor M5a [Corythoichthys intestinalis]|uniref:muscarinic acetylcholine receptor M5a n=1 Tax=Corythoichthys intestinalis TaxID=161448 RepID=UPI0025A545D9|nr:muscarinic acetylcholine receptor M5a [Corythoichthys intestinalis]XP_061798483.1 muscarinic acetylcholine receptor M5-like [Nerophis lumbriciformis]
MEAERALNATINSSTMDSQLVTHSLWEVVTIATVSAIVSLITIVGNILVMLSFKVNSQLKTVNNYYLLSLAAADLIIGIFSMNLYTSYILMGYWALGNLSCDLWLAVDYVASNASVMNLLAISFDRYFSITRPLTYRAKRTPRRAGVMIGLAWLVSLILWAPPILCWQYFVGKRTVPERQCQIQFFSEPIITFGTAIAAFYIPVSVMTILYCRIYKETEKRTKDLAELQGANQSAQPDVTKPQMIRSCFSCKLRSGSKDCTQASWSSSCRNQAAKSAASNTDEWSKAGQLTTYNSYPSSEDEDKSVSFGNQVCEVSKSAAGSETEQLSSFDEENFYQTSSQSNSQRSSKRVSYKFKSKDTLAPHPSKNGDAKSAFSSAESMSTQAASSASKDVTLKNHMTKRKRMVLIKERKAAQTLSAILLAFILTWTPYNIMVLISTFCSDCIPLSLWHLGYWLCYVNSTVNPMCYALCNKTFQKTFRMLLLCQWKKKRIEEKLYWYGQNPIVGSKLS